MRISKTSRPAHERASRAQPEPWTVTFTAWLDDETKVTWDYFCTWSSDDHNAGARGLAQMQKYTTYGVTTDDVLYPAHRIQMITWETT